MKKRKWKIGLVVLLVIFMLALAVAPTVVKNQVIKRSPELFGRQISLEKLKVNYFSSKVRLMDFTLYEAEEAEAFVSFDTLLVNLAPLRLIRHNLVIEQVYLSGLTARIWQHDSLFNFTDLIEFHQPEPDTLNSDTLAKTSLRYAFSNLELSHARFEYTDASIDKTIYMRDLSFFVPHLAWNMEERSEAGIRFNFHREGYFESVLNLDPQHGEFDAEMSIHHLYLDEFTEFLQKSLPLDSLGGLINTNIYVQGDLDSIEQTRISGGVELLGFTISDQNEDELIGIDKLNVSFNEINLQNQRFLFDSLTLAGPHIHFALYDSSNNFFDFLGLEVSGEADSTRNSGEESDSLGVDTGSSLFFALNSFEINDGIMDYTDHRTGEPFEYHLSEMHMSVDSLSNQEDWINLNAQMLLNNRGNLNAELGINPQDPMNMNLEVAISDFMLSDLNIYSRHYLGSPILRGDMYYKSTTDIRGGQLSSENRLIIENVEVGEKEGGLHDLPLKFAVFLLKDREGVIDLDVPVRGDLKDPKVSVGKIVWNTFKNLIVKTVAAPYDLLADMIGVDPDDIRALEFAYGDSLLNEVRTEQLNLLLSLEEKKEGLGMELIYYNDAQKESQVIFQEEAAKRQSPLSEADSVELVRISAEITELFTRTRMRLVDDYLQSMNDSTTIFTSRSHADAPGNLGSIPRFEVKYSMGDYNPED